MIWLDVDDVVADLCGYMEGRYGELEPGFGWDCWEPGWIEQVNWLELQPTPWARELVELVRSRGEYGYMTACIHQDRKFWLDWFDPGCLVVCTNNKGVLLREEDIIIDDNPSDDWAARVVRVPAKWWTTVGPDTLTIIRRQLDEAGGLER